MNWLERLKIIMRARKYRNKADKGGIAYILSSVKSGQTVFDIGAHKAGYLYFMARQAGEKGKVFAFEPQALLFNYIKRAKEIFRWQNLTVEHMALSDAAGTVTLYIPENEVSKGSSPGATIVKRENSTGISFTQEVTAQTLDNYCSLHQLQPNFLKIDVEGNELQIFRGGINTLKAYKPKILVEIEARHVGKEKVLETFRFLESLGYKGYFLNDLKHIPISGFDFEKHQNTAQKNAYCNNFIFE